jgi:hypothetical protein
LNKNIIYHFFTIQELTIMNTLRYTVLCCALALTTHVADAKQYVFPKNGQTPEQQAADEAACHTWAVGETGVDPTMTAQEAAPEAAAPAPAKSGPERGSGARGAVAGAAAGAVIAEIGDDDRSDAAQTGAAVGVVSARNQSRREGRKTAETEAQVQQEAQVVEQQTQQQSEQDTQSYYKALSTCLDAKGYSVSE